MMDVKLLTIVYLSLLLNVYSFFWMKAEKHASYLQGQTDLYQLWTKPGVDMDDSPYVAIPKRGHK